MSGTAPSFLLVDKDPGWTSHDVVAKVRGLVRERRVGHGGTLDPMATGLLILGIGRATRLLRFVQELPKEYLARATFGVATDTLDADGAVLSRHPMPVGEDDVRGLLPRFTGQIAQVPPMVSALRVEGRRLYDLARRGQEVEREARTVEIHQLELLDFAPGEYPEALLIVVCGKGTYVRSLADDLARALGGRAHLTELRRTRLGSFGADRDAHRIPDLEKAAEEDRIHELLVPPAEGLRDLPSVVVDAETARGVGHGMQFPRGGLGSAIVEGQLFRVLDGDGRLLAVYGGTGRRVSPEVVLR